MLITVDSQTYNSVLAAIPEHPGRLVEVRRLQHPYYVSQRVFTVEGKLAAETNE